MKFSPTPLDTDETMVHFEVESLDGKSVEFSVPKAQYRSLPVNRKIRAWVEKNLEKITDEDLFIHMVETYSEPAATFIRTAEIQAGQLTAMMDYYRKESAVDEGELDTSSES